MREPQRNASEAEWLELSGPNGYALTYAWTEDGVSVGGNSPTLTVTVPLGTHTFALTVTDTIGFMNTATVQVTVRDTTPPTLNVSLSPNLLWPPNGKMTQINATTSVSDVCDSNPTVMLLSLVSSEPGPGRSRPLSAPTTSCFSCRPRGWARVQDACIR